MDTGIDFVRMAAVAVRMIEANGRQLIIRRGATPGDDYDPVIGEGGTPTGPQEIPIRAVVLGMTSGYAMKVGTENIEARDRLLLVSPEVQPIITDLISFDDEDWQVIRVEETAPNGTPVLYECQVRP